MAKAGLGLEITELRLGLPGDNNKIGEKPKEIKKRVFSKISSSEDENGVIVDCPGAGNGKKVAPATAPASAAKGQIVGWPPVCSFRRKNSCREVFKVYVKVSMDGVPYLRKVDLGLHQGYDDFAVALEKLFGCYGIGGALKDVETSEFVTIYEDKDGDWMLAGDVPWQMFIESCRRLRIMKRSDATGLGLQPRGLGDSPHE